MFKSHYLSFPHPPLCVSAEAKEARTAANLDLQQPSGLTNKPTTPSVYTGIQCMGPGSPAMPEEAGRLICSHHQSTEACRALRSGHWLYLPALRFETGRSPLSEKQARLPLKEVSAGALRSNTIKSEKCRLRGQRLL